MTEFSFTGVYQILPTPFRDDESLDHESLANFIRFLKQIGVDGLTLFGILGEANRLSDMDREAVLATALEASDGLPIIVGTSHTGTETTADLTKMAERQGATACMIAPSKQATPSDQTIFDYYSRVREKTSLPIIVQDHPGVTEVHMTIDLLCKIVNEVPDIAGIKAESVPSPQKIYHLKEALKNGKQVPVLPGLGALYSYFDLEAGSDGFNTGFSFPEILVAMTRANLVGDIAEVLRIYTKFLPLLVFEKQPGLAIRKEILNARGLLASNRVRHPGGAIDPFTRDQVHRIVNSVIPDQDITKPISV
jgi:4-hydroxy-tetrahydrodipicolinate synthase